MTLIGDDAASCIITWDDYAGRDNGAGGTPRHFGKPDLPDRSQRLHGQPRHHRQHLRQQPGKYRRERKTQAVSVQVKADRAAFLRMPHHGYQDTFYGRGTGVSTCATATSRATSTSSSGRRFILLDSRCTLHMNRNNSVVTPCRPLADHNYGIVCMAARSPFRRAARRISTVRHSPTSIWDARGRTPACGLPPL